MPRKRSSATAVCLPSRATGLPTVQIPPANHSEPLWLPWHLDLPRSRLYCRPQRKATRARSTPHFRYLLLLFAATEELIAELLPEAAQDARAMLPDRGC